MREHSRYEELCATASVGQISAEELSELRAHLKTCDLCRKLEAEFLEINSAWLAQVPKLDSAEYDPPTALRRSILVKLQKAGAEFSETVRNEISEPPAERIRSFSFGRLHRPALAWAAGLIIVAGSIGFAVGSMRTRHQASKAQSSGDAAKFATQLAERDQEVANLQEQLRDSNAQLATALKTAQSYRRESSQKGVQPGQSTSQRAQLQDELQNGEKQLQAANEEIARINQLRATDKASLEAQRLRIREISDQLRIADATLEMERQLSAEGKDIRELLVARQLRVVDVRDMDENGKPARTFGRVFLTEGKSLMFFAFDLNDAKGISGNSRYQVWGEQVGKKGSARSLGVLSIDDKMQNRWALKVDNPALLNDVNYVYVTSSSSAGVSSGQRMLYAFLGEPGNTPTAN